MLCAPRNPYPTADTVREQIHASLVETFRKALMEKHHQDWDMETISEAAHICAEAWEDRLWPRHSDGVE